MTPPDPMQVRSRNRRMLLVLFLFFFGSVLLAGLLRFSGWRPEGSKNKGEMLSPYGDMRGHAPQLRDGGAYRWKDSPRTWRIAVMPRECDGARAQACTRLLGDLDKVWQLMGKDADRVHVLWIGALPPGATVPSELRVLQPDEALRAGLPRARAAAGENPDGDAAWLVDPYGFTVLRYAPGFDPGDLRTDLARLLKIN